MITHLILLGLIDGAGPVANTPIVVPPFLGSGGGTPRSTPNWSYIKKKVEDAKSDIADGVDVKKAIASIGSAIDQVNDSLMKNQYRALRLRSDRLKDENNNRAKWQADLANAALIIEFQALLAGITSAVMFDDEDAVLLLLLM